MCCSKTDFCNYWLNNITCIAHTNWPDTGPRAEPRLWNLITPKNVRELREADLTERRQSHVPVFSSQGISFQVLSGLSLLSLRYLVWEPGLGGELHPKIGAREWGHSLALVCPLSVGPPRLGRVLWPSREQRKPVKCAFHLQVCRHSFLLCPQRN